MKKINIIIIGGSFNSTIGSTHIKSIFLCNKYNILGYFFSRNKSINKMSAIKYGLDTGNLYYNLDDLINYNLKNLDAAVVLVPPNTKFKIIKKLIINNIDIISEKPLCSSVIEAKKIKNLINKYKVSFYTTYNYLGYPAIIQMKNMLKKIGTPKILEIEMPQETFVKSNKKIASWRKKDEKIPIILLDLASHCLAFTNYFYNLRPIKYFAHSILNIQYKVVDTFDVLIKYKSFYSKISVNKSKFGERNDLSIKIYGNLGSIKWFHNKPEEIIFSNKKNFKSIIRRSDYLNKIKNNNEIFTYKDGHPNGFIDAFSNIYKSIYFLITRKLRKKTFPKILNLDENINIIKDLEKISISAKKEKWIKN